MKTKRKTLKPKFKTFLGLFILSLTLTLFIRAVLQVTASVATFDLNTAIGWLNTFGYPLFISLGVTFGARRLQLEVYEAPDMEGIKDSALEYLGNNGLRLKGKNENNIELESTAGFNRLFNNWFGTEIINLRYAHNKIIIEGPFRQVDSIHSKLKFGGQFK